MVKLWISRIDPVIYTKLEEEKQIIGHVVQVNFISHFVDLTCGSWICSTWMGKGWSTFESPCDRYEEWIDQVSIVTVYSMILGLLWIQKRYLKSIFLVTKNSPPKTDPSTCVWLHMSTGLLDEPTLIWEMVGWPLQKPGRHVQLSVGIRKSTEVLLWSRMLEGLSFDLSTLPSHSHPPKMFFPDKIRAS